MQNCGEASPDAVSTTSEGTQELRDDLVTATVLWGSHCPSCLVHACLGSFIHKMAARMLPWTVLLLSQLAIPVLYSLSLFCLYCRRERWCVHFFLSSFPFMFWPISSPVVLGYLGSVRRGLHPTEWPLSLIREWLVTLTTFVPLLRRCIMQADHRADHHMVCSSFGVYLPSLVACRVSSSVTNTSQ